MNPYDPNQIEKKWQTYWQEEGIFNAKESSDNQKKFFALIEFPYPSGEGLHVGHPRPYIGMDVISHKRRMEGYNVLYPIGWDAFGLPTENYAIKTGIQPAIVTQKNTDTFRRQIQALGISFDWSREINTTDPAYYKWTQWIFLQFLKKGLAYKKKMSINWCPKDLIGLANEEVINGRCERCGTLVEKRDKEQWMLAITKYAERLDKDLDDVNYLDRIKTQQRNWIGKSEGAEITFKIVFSKGQQSGYIPVFTTRPDTLFGVTYIVLSPEHLWVTLATDDDHIGVLDNVEEVKNYIAEIKKKTDIERTDAKSPKTGVELKGVKAVNPINGEEVSIWIADYVLADYGTGAVMAVPAHDERDYLFAEKYGLEIRKVIDENGILFASDKFDGKNSNEIKKEITEAAGGKWVTKFKLRDWVFSRQRYWGEPIPVVHCEKCGIVPLPESELPLKLPEVKNYQPTETGESPLATITEWVNTTCPTCGGKARRETDTMPNWAGSSWYYLRYVDPRNDTAFADRKKLDYWTPVDWYNGGMEHTTLHLLYSRFWHKFLFDLGLVPTHEPYQKRTSHGLIMAQGGEKMSKSKGNVVNPDDIIKAVGADALRVYEMFMGPFDQAISWDENGIVGTRRFLEKIWKLSEKVSENSEENSPTETLIQKTIKKVSEDIEAMKFNTAISALMIAVNEIEKQAALSKKHYQILIQLIAPFAPHITEELWQKLSGVVGNKTSIFTSVWPTFDPSKLVGDTVRISVQINGKARGSFSASPEAPEDELRAMALSLPETIKWMEGKEPKKVIVVAGKLVSIVV